MAEYTIKKGDTLSGIAKEFLGDQSRYGEIAALNKIKNPNRIRAGRTIMLPDGAAGPVDAPPPIPRPRPSLENPASSEDAMLANLKGKDIITAEPGPDVWQEEVAKIAQGPAFTPDSGDEPQPEPISEPTMDSTADPEDLSRQQESMDRIAAVKEGNRKFFEDLRAERKYPKIPSAQDPDEVVIGPASTGKWPDADATEEEYFRVLEDRLRLTRPRNYEEALPDTSQEEQESAYSQRYDWIMQDLSLDKLGEQIADPAAQESELIAIQMRDALVGDKWVASQTLLDRIKNDLQSSEIKKNAREGKYGLPGGEKHDSFMDAISAYAGNLGTFISESIITPARGEELPEPTPEQQAILDRLEGEFDSELEDIKAMAVDIQPVNGEKGVVDAMWPTVRDRVRAIMSQDEINRVDRAFKESNIIQAAAEVASLRPVIGGILDFLESSGDFLQEVAEGTGINAVLEDLGVPRDLLYVEGRSFPDAAQPKYLPGQLIRSVTQFVASYLTTRKFVGAPGPGAPGYAKDGLTWLIATTIGAEGDMENFADLLGDVPGVGPVMKEYLGTDEEDPELLKRLKNGLTDVLIAKPLADATMLALRSVKARVQAKKAVLPAEPPKTSMLRNRLGPDDVDDFLVKVQKSAKELEAGVSDDAMVKSMLDKGLVPLDRNKTLWVNFNKLDGTDRMKQTIQDIATATKDSTTAAKRGVRTWANTDASKRQIDALKLMATRKTGQALNAEELGALGDLWVAADNKLIELADVAARSVLPEDQLAFRRMLAIFDAVNKEYMGATAEAGRSLNFLKQMRGLGAAERSIQVENAINQLGGLDNSRNLAEAIQKLRAAEGRPTALLEFADKVATNNLSTRAHNWFMFSLLSGIKTQLRNAGGSAIMIPVRMMETAMSARLGKILGSKDAVLVGEATAQWYGVKTSFKDAAKIAAHAFRTGESPFNPIHGVALEKFGFNPKVARNALSADSMQLRSGLLGRSFDWITALTGRGMMFSDTYFKYLHQNATVWQEGFRKAARSATSASGAVDDVMMRDVMIKTINQVPDDIAAKGLKAALHNTFNDPAGPWLKRMMEFRTMGMQPGASGWEKVAGWAVKVTAPFMRTPRNLLATGFEYTPLATTAKGFREAIQAGGGKADLALTKIAMGTMLMGTIYDYALDGRITGPGPDPRTEPGRFAFWQRSGRQPESILIGDTWYSYRGWEPWSFQMGWAAALGEWSQNSNFDDPDEYENFQTAIGYGIIAIAGSTLNSSFMRGPSELFSVLDDADPDQAGRWFQNLVTSYTSPVFIRDIGQAIDPTYRYTTDFIQGTMKKWGFGQGLPAMTDLYGRERYAGGGEDQEWTGMAYDFFSPSRAKESKIEPIDAEWEKIGYYPPNTQKSISVPAISADGRTGSSERVSLNGNRIRIYSEMMLQLNKKPSEWTGDMGKEIGRQLKKAVGGDFTVLELLNSIVSGDHPLSRQYQQLENDDQRKNVLLKVRNMYHRASQAWILDRYPELSQIANRRYQRRIAEGEVLIPRIEPAIQ